MAYSTVVLNWGYLRYKDAYDAAGQSNWLLDSVKWPLDYLLKCYIPHDVSDPNDDELYVQVMTSTLSFFFLTRCEMK
jgi:hypothetical protein